MTFHNGDVTYEDIAKDALACLELGIESNTISAAVRALTGLEFGTIAELPMASSRQTLFGFLALYGEYLEFEGYVFDVDTDMEPADKHISLSLIWSGSMPVWSQVEAFKGFMNP